MAQVDEGRDALEIPLVRQAWEQGIPILGICRGEQILNVALGGSLHQDIPDQFGCPRDFHQHGSAQDPGELHPVTIAAGTTLAALLGDAPILVNSRHHQAVRRIAPGLRASAFHSGTRVGDSCLVEGIESIEADRWAIGVQWHPEDLAERTDAVGDAARKLFNAFTRLLGSRKTP
jgi:putative glutamine amidotransferase